MATRLHPESIRSIVGTFPCSGGWQTVQCADLRARTTRRPDARNWSPFAPADSKGGVYAFLFPKRVFVRAFQIKLHGPSGRSIRFEFSAIPNLLVGSG